MADPPESESQSPTEEESLLDLERRAGPYVLYRDDAGRKRVFDLPDMRAPVTIGRGSWMDISLPWDDGASRLHARLERVADDWTVIDDGTSRNGTFLNGERIEGRRRLNDGDQLRIGETQLRVCLPGTLDEGNTAILDRPPAPPEDE